MSKVSHAPGPWIAGCAETDLGVQITVKIYRKDNHGDDGGFLIAQLPFDAEDWANARLIAAAPDLLAACNACMEGKGDHITMMATAIAKAEGRS